MIEKVKSAFNSVGEKIGVSGTAVGIAVLTVLVLLLALVIFLIVKGAKKSKKSNQAAKSATAVAVESETEKTAENESESKPESKPETPAETALPAQEKPAAPAVPAAPADPAAASDTANVATEKGASETENKPVAKKIPAKKTAQADKTAAAAKPSKRMLGKWRVIIKGENAYIAALSASNGEVMLTSEIYSTEDGARNGVATIIKGVETGNFVIYRDKGGDYYYKLKSAGNRLLCVGEIYKTKDACEKAAQSVKRIAKDSPVAPGVAEGERFISYVPAEVAAPAKGRTGKWKIEQSENGGFSAKLYANNGQIMLSTEEVASRKTAEKAVESVRKNCAEGNFYIDKDKFGRFYYKLHNAQRSVICTGETYDTVDGVVSAIESVRRFAAYAELNN